MRWPGSMARAGVLALYALSQPAAACSFDGLYIGRLDVAYPGSMSVAMSIAAARAGGTLPAAGSAGGEEGLEAARSTLQAFRDHLARYSGAPARSFSVLFTGSRLWSVMTGYGLGFRLLFHARGPMIGQPVVLTEQVVLDAILDGRMSVAQAQAAGLLVVKNDRGDRVAGTLRAAFPSA